MDLKTSLLSCKSHNTRSPRSPLNVLDPLVVVLTPAWPSLRSDIRLAFSPGTSNTSFSTTSPPSGALNAARPTPATFTACPDAERTSEIGGARTASSKSLRGVIVHAAPESMTHMSSGCNSSPALATAVPLSSLSHTW
ncbi:hypothetical protein CLOP_g308 [Closterium sp. NIES-67]|nr:hypothetical protein CLOP_g308 [Closterium sp. NIES-67]